MRMHHRVNGNIGTGVQKGDLMLNGAFFRQTGAGASSTFARASSLSARPSSLVGSITGTSGALNCRRGGRC
ncbi:AmbAllergen [Corchorus olitorius]|uniref:AmbAllergen n=1 Tax=Corchorus olitorius TaxID=93759 RepID=A0A1R3L4U0_9ROSI|nr:AmbAllergen [Corchorus olitorius]